MRSPVVAALTARDVLALISAKNNLNKAAAVSAERIQVGALPSECWRIVPNHGGEVTDRYELVARADPPDQAIKVEPQVATTVPVVEPMVEIEPVYVAMTA